MTLTRADWRRIGRAVLVGAGPGYARELREKAQHVGDSDTRQKYLQLAALVEDLSDEPEATVDGVEVLYDALFGAKPKRRRTTPRSKRRK